MRKGILIGFAALGLVLLSSQAARASGDGPSPVYASPAHLDLDYIAAHDGRFSAVNAQYRLLLGQYAPIPAMPERAAYTNLHMQQKTYSKAAQQMLTAQGVAWEPDLNRLKMTGYFYDINSPGCISNNPDSGLAFLRAVLADPAIDKAADAAFAQARLDVFMLCSSAVNPSYTAILDRELNDLAEIPAAKDYAAYLRGARYFYRQDYASALEIYKALSKTKNGPWLKETAAYMVARILIAQAQEDWDGYSDPAHIDRKILAKAERALEAYRRDYPAGTYADSVTGFKRRIAFLKNDRKALDRMLKDMMTRDLDGLTGPDSAPENPRHMVEFIRYYQGKMEIGRDHPLLIALFLLADPHPSRKYLAALEKRQVDFKHYDGLGAFLAASIYYKNADYAGLLKNFPQDQIANTPAAIGLAVMRARSAALLGDADQAIAIWRAINAVYQDDVTQLTLAGLYADRGAYERINEKGGVLSPSISAHIMQFSASTSVLKTLLEQDDFTVVEKEMIRQELFRRTLLSGQFAELAALYDQVGDAGRFEILRDAIQRLAISGDDASALLAVGKFIYGHYLTPLSRATGKTRPFEASGYEEVLPYCQSCALYPDRAAEMIPAYPYFVNAARLLRQQKNPQEAEALHFLVKCFRGSEYIDRCQWNRHETNNSKDAFKRLHRQYPQSIWAQKTPYYYK